MKNSKFVIVILLILGSLEAFAIDSSKLFCEDYFAKLQIKKTSSVTRGEVTDSLLDVLVTRVYRHDDYLITDDIILLKQRIVEGSDPKEYVKSLVETLDLSEEDIYRYGNFVRIFEEIDPNDKILQDYFNEWYMNDVQKRNFLYGVRRVQQYREAIYEYEKVVELSQRTDRPYYSPRFARVRGKIVDLINDPYAYGMLSPNYEEALEIYRNFFVRFISPFKAAHIRTVSEMAVDIHFNHRREGYIKRSLLQDLIPIVEAYTGEPVEGKEGSTLL